MSYSVIDADLKTDKNAILSLWKRNFVGVSDERYRWIYENSSSGLPAAYLLKHSNTKSIIGAISLFPRAIFMNGEHIPAWICGDLAVDKEHRTLGPALKLLKAVVSRCEKAESGILLGFPNDESEPAMRHAGFDTLSEYFEMTKLIKTFSYIQKFMKSQTVASMLSIPLDFIFRWQPAKYYWRSLTHYNADMAIAFDDRFDTLWENMVKQFNFVGKRNSNFLNWRYTPDGLHTKYCAYTLAMKSEKALKGYVVFCVNGKRVQVSDFGFSGKEEDFAALIASFSRYQRTQGIESIALGFAGHTSLFKAIKANGYMVRSRGKKIVIYASSKHKEIVDKIRNGNWFLTSADNDI